MTVILSKLNYDKEDIKDRISKLIEVLSPEQCKHFTYALEEVANCYISQSSHGALLIYNDSDESQSLIAINASEKQIAEMVGFMADAMRSQHSSSRMYVN